MRMRKLAVYEFGCRDVRDVLYLMLNHCLLSILEKINRNDMLF